MLIHIYLLSYFSFDGWQFHWKSKMAIPVCMTMFLVASLSHNFTFGLDYSSRELTTVPMPPTSTETVFELDLADNNIQSLNDISFIGYDDLKSLDLGNNGLKYVYDGTFIKMQQLEELQMKGNNIMYLPSVFGPSTKTLKDFGLWAAFSGKSVLVYPYFAAFVSLRELNIGANDNSQSFDATLLPKSLTFLGLNYGEISNFPILSLYTPLLREIDISHNDIETIPQSAITWLSQLVELEADDNRITNFPSFVNCTLLERLFMQWNQITVTPRKNIEGLTSLHTFYLQHNRLTFMTNISYLTSLEEFKIGYNRISELPVGVFHGLPNLKKLSCEFNHIAALPNVVALLPSLQEFDVQGNRLLILPDYYAHSSPLTFHIQSNPLVCNHSLCWLRLLTWANRTSPLKLDSPTCAEPPLAVNTLVVRAHPTTMKCYHGKCL